MVTLTPTKDTGATAIPNDVLYVEPTIAIDATALEATVALENVDVAFVASFLSACLAHERRGVHLYRSAAGRTQSPALKAKYEEFGQQTLRHVEILEQLIASAGGNPNYVSSLARATEAADAKLVEATYLGSGSLEPVVQESAILDAVFLAETIDHANWEALAMLSGLLPDCPAKDAMAQAVAEVSVEEDEHLGWAQQTRARLTVAQATPSLGDKVGAKVRDVADTVRSWVTSPDASMDLAAMTKEELYNLAQERDIAGRSAMTKDELMEALRS